MTLGDLLGENIAMRHSNVLTVEAYEDDNAASGEELEIVVHLDDRAGSWSFNFPRGIIVVGCEREL
jgi:hypothetical protein